MKRDFVLLLLVACLAYAGGYYYGRNPGSTTELKNSKSLVIATTQHDLLSPKLQGWLEDRWGHSLIVQVWTDEEIKNQLSHADLVILPKAGLDPLRSQLADRDANFDVEKIHPDFLRERSKSIPVLWRLRPLEDGRYRLYLMELAWTQKGERTDRLVTWLLSEEFQAVWAKRMRMNPVNRKLLETDSKELSNLRNVPLDKLRYD